MPYTPPTYNPEESYSREYTELDRKLAARKRAAQYEADEELASRGAGQGGARGAAYRGVEQDIGELWHQGAQAIESRRFAAEEAGRQRGWATGERVGSEAHQTNLQGMAAQAAQELQELVNTGQMDLQTANNEWQAIQNELGRGHELDVQGLVGEQAMEQLEFSGQQELATLEAQFGYSTELQSQAELAAYELQQLVQSGQMTMQEAQNEWQSIQNTLQQEHETSQQGAQIAQEQWAAQFGLEAAQDLQNDTQAFEEMMAFLNHDWELESRTWQEAMWGLDAQLQLTLGGWDWNDDGYPGGAPEWVWGGENAEGSPENTPSNTQGASPGSNYGPHSTRGVLGY